MDSIELRELEAQLRAAYTSKERMAQMAEKEALRYDEIVSVCPLVSSPESFNVPVRLKYIHHHGCVNKL